MSTLTNKLFDQLLKEGRIIEVGNLLGFFKDQQSDEYQQLAAASQDPLERTNKLKLYVLKSYKDGTLKDLEFFKYLAWSGQGDLCKMIGYSDRQIDKWQKNMPQTNAKPHIITVNSGIGDEEMDTDQAKMPSSAFVMNDSQDVVPDGPICHKPATTVFTTPTYQQQPSSAFIVYSKEDKDEVLCLSDFLRSCKIDCEIDQYHTNKQILDWGQWVEKNVRRCAPEGFILLVCSPVMYQYLCDSVKPERVEMGVGHIDTLSLRSLIKEANINEKVVPIFLDKYSTQQISSNLKERTSYRVSISKLMKVDPNDSSYTILKEPGLESLQRLVYVLCGIPEFEKPRVC